nr:hypothetical protein [Tanacetum cinerariifolium]
MVAFKCVEFLKKVQQCNEVRLIIMVEMIPAMHIQVHEKISFVTVTRSLCCGRGRGQINVCLCQLNMAVSNMGKAVMCVADDRDWEKVIINNEIMYEIYDQYGRSANIIDELIDEILEGDVDVMERSLLIMFEIKGRDEIVKRKKVNRRYVVENVLMGCGGAYVGMLGDKKYTRCNGVRECELAHAGIICGANLLQDKMDDPNITMEEYIRLRKENARRRVIVLNDALTSEVFLSCEPTVSPLGDNKIDFRISFDESDDEDYVVTYDKNSFSYKIKSVDDLKTDSDNDNDKVNKPSFPSTEPTLSLLHRWWVRVVGEVGNEVVVFVGCRSKGGSGEKSGGKRGCGEQCVQTWWDRGGKFGVLPPEVALC